MNKRNIALIILVLVIVGSIFYLDSKKVKPIDIEENVEMGRGEEILKDGQYSKAPELAGISGFLNTDNEEIMVADFKGKVVLIDFWTYTCINCIRTFPFLNDWDEKYRDSGLVIIGVHTPEFEFEKNIDNVQKAIEKYDIKYRVVQDNDYVTWRAFENKYWPRKYLIDSEGYIRYDHIGEGGYEETELKIQELLAEIGEDMEIEIGKEESNLRLKTTPELYAGAGFALPRGQNIGNDGGLREGVSEYSLPEVKKQNIIYLEGEWKSNLDDLKLVSNTGTIFLDFTASEVNIVADSIEEREMEVLIYSGLEIPENMGEDIISSEIGDSVFVKNPRLYNVYEGKYGTYSLELKVKDGFSFNAFTFG